ncbi:hypothetical protein PINS_up001271 [Pythium insidiosum]|nr:hypothetical protein PINS_up001271 [Pythium insidiosum]
MQTFLRSVTKPKGVDTAFSLYGSSSNSSSAMASTSTPAPFLRAKTFDRLRHAAPFTRTTTQRALDLTTASSSSTSSSSSSVSSSATRARPVVDSIWLITVGACSCRDTIVALTDELIDARRRRRRRRMLRCYCALIDELGTCGHPSEAKAVFEECLSGSALLALSGIAAIPSFWKVFSALLRCYVRNGLVQRAFELLVQVQLDDEALLDPSLGALRFRADVVSPPTRELVVERVVVTFSWGNLGLCLIPRCAATSAGCELLSFQRRRRQATRDTGGLAGRLDAREEIDDDDDVDDEDEQENDESEDDDDASDEDSPSLDVEQRSGLKPHDVVETINGEHVLHRQFHDIVLALRQAPRPVTVSFLRGLDMLERSQRSASSTGRSASAASASSTSAVVNGKTARVPDATSRTVHDTVDDDSGGRTKTSTLGAGSRPRRDLVDRFGWLPRHGIRVTTLADCHACSTRLSLTEVQRGWSSNAHDYTTRCVACSHRFVPRLCVVLGAGPNVKVEHLEYLSTPVIRKELSNLAQKVPLTLLSMRDLREMNPRLYWNIVVKLLALAVPLDFLDLPDMTHQLHDQHNQQQERQSADLNQKTTESKPEASDWKNESEKQLLTLVRQMMDQAKQQQTRGSSADEEVLTQVIKAVETRLRDAMFGSEKGVRPTIEQARRRTERLPHENNEDEDNESEDERETDVEDMRSSRTLSVTESMHSELDIPSLSNAADAAAKRSTRNSKFMASLPSAPFRRISRTVPTLH